MEATEYRYEITLSCDDTYSSNVRPGLGNTRRCIHCETRQKVTHVKDCQEVTKACANHDLESGCCDNCGVWANI